MLQQSQVIQRFPEIHRLADTAQLLELLECPICKEIPFPPIYNCEVGHIICCFCKSKLRYCPLCRANFSEGRNFPVESIVLHSQLKCKYSANGCPTVLKGEQMMDHVQSCKFREHKIACHIGRYTRAPCRSEEIPLTGYLDHLKKAHMMLPNVPKNGKIVFESRVLESVTDTFWLGDYTTFDSNVFVVHQFMKDYLIYFSLAIIADKDEAKKYTTEVHFTSKKNKVTKASFTIPVHSILDASRSNSCAVLPFEFIKSHSSILPCSSEGSSKSSKSKLIFHVEYAIKFKNSQ